MEKDRAFNSNVRLKYASIIPVMIGIITFLIIYGLTPLNVANDHWIMPGYDENDIIQHYAGWLAFRNSGWEIPLGMADQMAVGTGTVISYTDSIPIVAIILKLFRNILPETFQYFGLFVLVCYILQSVAAFKILMLKTKNVNYSTIGTLLFSFAPILLERSFRHTALGAQWLILFSIYLYLKYQTDSQKNVYAFFMILEILAIGIHPYFLPMVGCFALLCVVYDIRKKKYRSIIYLLSIQIVTYLFGCAIGVLGSGVEVSRDGYGYYSMNINAVINPSSCGQYTWSAILKPLPQILGNYDGFNYLGVGIWFLGIVTVLLLFVRKKTELFWQMIKEQFFLIGICIILTCFAISNVVTYNDSILFTVPLPEFLINNVCGIFRASSRMFYPVYYMIFLALLTLLWRMLKDENRKWAYGILGFVVALQLFDLHVCIAEKHRFMNEMASYISYTDDAELDRIGENAKSILLEDFWPSKKALAVWAFKHNMTTYFTVANSGNYYITDISSAEILTDVKATGNIGRNVIATSNSEIADLYDQFDNISVYEIEDIYFIYDNGET